MASAYVRASPDADEKDNGKLTVKVSALILLGLLWSTGETSERSDIYWSLISESNTTGKVTKDCGKLKCTFYNSLKLANSFLMCCAIWGQELNVQEGNRKSFEE